MLAFLVCNCAGGLASRLAGSLALAAAGIGGSVDAGLFDGSYMLHGSVSSINRLIVTYTLYMRRLRLTRPLFKHLPHQHPKHLR